MNVGAHTLFTTGTSAPLLTQNGSNFIVMVFDVLGQAHTLIDSKGNVYALRGTELNSGTAIGLKCYYVENGIGGAAHTWTISGGVAPSAVPIEIQGAPTSSSVDIDFAGRGTTAPFTSGNATATAQANELFISAIASDSGVNPSAFTISGNGFTTVLEQQQDGASEVCGAVAAFVASGIDTPNPTWTAANATSCAVGLITIKAAAASGGVPTAWLKAA